MLKKFILFQFLLTISAPSFAQSAKSASCPKTLAQLKQKNKDLYNDAKTHIHGDTSQLDKCLSMFNEHLDDCDITPKFNDYCLKTGQLTSPVNGTTGAIDNQISSMVNTANCQFAMSNCYASTSVFEDLKNTNPYVDCMVDQIKTAAQHDYADPADADQAGNAEAINKYATQFYSQIDRPQGECWRNTGYQTEVSARRTLADSMSLKTGAALSETIYCVNNDNGNRVCMFDPTGRQTFKETAMDDGHPDVGTTSPGRFLASEDKGVYCGGSLLGDGTTYVTAGHCTQSLTSPDQTLAVTDASGYMHYVDATCGSSPYAQTTKADIGICTLNTPVPAKPVYYATLDTSNPGNSCSDSGYVMSCGEGWFKNLTNQPVTMWAYPVQVDDSNFTTTRNLTESTGTLIYDPSSQQLTTDMMCTGGCSGSGYFVDVGGRTVIVAADSYSSRYDVGSGAAAVPTQVFQGLTVPSVSTQKLQNGAPVFQGIPF